MVCSHLSVSQYGKARHISFDILYRFVPIQYLDGLVAGPAGARHTLSLWKECAERHLAGRRLLPAKNTPPPEGGALPALPPQEPPPSTGKQPRCRPTGGALFSSLRSRCAPRRCSHDGTLSSTVVGDPLFLSTWVVGNFPLFSSTCAPSGPYPPAVCLDV